LKITAIKIFGIVNVSLKINYRFNVKEFNQNILQYWAPTNNIGIIMESLLRLRAALQISPDRLGWWSEPGGRRVCWSDGPERTGHYHS